MREIVVAGNYSHDTLIGAAERSELGGSAAYISTVLRAADVDFSVVANVGDDFRYAALVPPARVVAGARTTSFVDDYRTGERLATLRTAGPSIAPDDLREPCTIGIAAAVAAEIPAPTLLRLRDLSRTLLADAQGFVRAFDASGRVTHRPPPADLLAALARVDYLKVGRAEADALDLAWLRGSCTILLTDGDEGCRILSRTGDLHVPAFPAHEVDPTGAGDCFLAGFAIGLLRGWPVPRAARLGNWCGARAVESPGLPTLDAVPKDLD